MATKLTLSVSEEVSKMAHELAKEKATSISKMFSEFIKSKSKRYKVADEDLHPLVKEFSGKYKVPKGVNPKEDKEWLIHEKMKKHDKK